MNNPHERRHSLGEWITEQNIKAEKALVWVFQPGFARSLLEDAEVDRIIGLSPDIRYGRGTLDTNVEVANTYSHNYTGEEFDLEYGWAIADDIKTSLEPQIEPEVNLHQYDYSDIEERDEALENAFSRITQTSDRLLKEEDSTVVYNLDDVRRYELPKLGENIKQNQLSYADRLADNLEKRGFSTEIVEGSEFLDSVHLIGRR